MTLNILNVGQGDFKLSWEGDEQKKRATEVVKDLLKRGFAILVEAGERNGKKLYERVTHFDANTHEYVVAGKFKNAIRRDILGYVVRGKEGKQKAYRRIPAPSVPAIAVARSAGGMSDRADSVEMRNLEHFDDWSQVRGKIAEIAEMKGEWAGIPMPLEGQPLVVEPKFPRAKELMEIGREDREAPERDIRVRNRFYSARKRCDILVFEENGKVTWGWRPRAHSLDIQVQTIGASVAWGIEQEARALQLLATLLPHHAFKKYLLTGMFLEKSARSGVTYVFRKLRPTVAISQWGEELKILCACCAHPVAYYQGSGAGAMAPTDDIIAALMLMRGDEPMFWKRSNQHPAYRPEAGI